MDNNYWKDLHSGSSGEELVNLLVDEVEQMMQARFNVSGYSNGYPADYWIQEEMHHAERVAWLRKKLYKELRELRRITEQMKSICCGSSADEIFPDKTRYRKAEGQEHENGVHHQSGEHQPGV